MIPLAFTGNPKLGGCQMRGRDVASRLGVTFFSTRDLIDRSPDLRFRTLVLCKYWPHDITTLRRRCERLVLDPLDCWTQTKPNADPVDFWRWVKKQTGCDLMLATSPAAQATMEAAGVETILAPHAADPRIGSDWYCASGPVVYAGGQRFLGDQEPAIRAACKALGREYVGRYDRDCWQALKGAALSLCVRFGERTLINCQCKPTVKVANAARAGIPILATNDAAITTMVDCDLVTGDWQADIAEALRSDPPRYPHDLAQYARELKEHLA